MARGHGRVPGPALTIHPFSKYSTIAAARAGMVNAAGSIWGVMPYSCKRRGGDGADGGHGGPGGQFLKGILSHQPGEVVDRAGAGEGEDVHLALRQHRGGLRGHGRGRQGAIHRHHIDFNPQLGPGLRAARPGPARPGPGGGASRPTSAAPGPQGAPRPGRCRAPHPPPGYSPSRPGPWPGR